jgi:hypothetical protein
MTAEIGHFFDIYKELEPGKDTDVRGWQDCATAVKVIKAAFPRACLPGTAGRAVAAGHAACGPYSAGRPGVRPSRWRRERQTTMAADLQAWPGADPANASR